MSLPPVLPVPHRVSSSVSFPRGLSRRHTSVFQINFFKKGAEMFSQSMDSFLSSVADMVQR